MIANTGRKPSGINRQALRIWATVFLVAGIAGKSIIQNSILGLGSVNGEQLLEMMNQNSSVMGMVTLALVLQAVEVCAVPLFVFMLVEGFKNTSDLKMYFLRVAGVALLSEIPYNLAVGGKFIDLQSRNPAVGLVLCMVMMYLYQRYEGKSIGKILIKILVTVAGALWTGILGVEHGLSCVIICAALWFTWEKANLRTFIGCSASMCCCVASPFYMAAPLSFLAIHFYNGEKGEENKWVNYLAYPVLLGMFALASLVLM